MRSSTDEEETVGGGSVDGGECGVVCSHYFLFSPNTSHLLLLSFLPSSDVTTVFVPDPGRRPASLSRPGASLLRRVLLPGLCDDDDLLRENGGADVSCINDDAVRPRMRRRGEAPSTTASGTVPTARAAALFVLVSSFHLINLTFFSFHSS